MSDGWRCTSACAAVTSCRLLRDRPRWIAMSPWAFACSSDNYTDPPWPSLRAPTSYAFLPKAHQTPARATLLSTGHRNATYVACLECGREFQYDWSQMTIGEPLAVQPYATTDYQESRGLANSLRARFLRREA